jgi:hypothetical protein
MSALVFFIRVKWGSRWLRLSETPATWFIGIPKGVVNKPASAPKANLW